MSTTIDQRVVEMRFDNKQFESATRTTMSTLDKLKQSLNLTGASKGLEEINHVAKNNNMSILGSAVESVGKKFSALEVMGVTALVNLTNQAVNAGKRIVSALTIDPISDGFSEYEMTLNAIQTTMNATGKTAEEVEAQLKLLDDYADKTIYSTADMLNNLSKFTNAGVDLETAVKAMIGIANATAHAGGNASNASTAFYNLGQSIGTGFMTRMDYNSINNANVVTMELKNRLVDAAIAAGTLKKVGEDTYEAGNKTFSLQQLFIDGLQHQWATTEVMLKVFGDYGDETTDIGEKAYKAAQDIKTFSMMMDSLKASAGTGWKETWEHIFGNLSEATKFWTGLYNVISGIIDKMADWRNNLIKGAMGSPLIGAYVKIIEELNGKAETMKGALDTAADAMNNFGEIVDRVMNGEFGNGQARWDKLTEAGYNWAEVQNKVNEKMGSSVRHATELGKAQESLAKTEEEVQETRARTIEQLVEMTDAELKDLDLKPQEIKALRELQKQSEKTGIPIKELANDLSLLNGRSLLINSFKNIGDALVKTFNAIKNAWKGIFDPITSEHIYNIIAGFHKLTTYLEINEKTADNLTRTFKGVFAILDIVLTLTAGPLKLAFKALTSLLGSLDLDILDVTAAIGDVIVNFRDWIDEVVNFDAVFEFLAPAIKTVASAIKSWINENIHLTEWLEKITNKLAPAKEAISKWIEGFKNTDDIQQYIIDGIVGGLVKVKEYVANAFKNLGTTLSKGIEDACEVMLIGWTSVPTDIAEGFEKGFLWGVASIIKNIRSFCKKFIDTVKSLFGIHSPSRVMYEIGQNVIQGFINGVIGLYDAVISAVKNLFTGARDTIGDVDFSKPLDFIVEGVKKFGSKIAEVFSGIDFGKILAAALGVGMLVVAKKAIDVLEMFGKPLEGLGDMLSGIGEAFEGFGKNLKANAFKKNAQALLIISGAILVLVMAILPLTELSWEELGKAAASLVGLALVVTGLMLVMGLLDKLGGSTGSIKSTAKLIMVAGSLFLLAFAVKKLSDIALDDRIDGTIKLLTRIVGSMALLMFSFGLFVNADKGQHMEKAGIMIFKMAAALLTITTVIKIVSGFTYAEIDKGMKFLIGVGVLFALVVAVSKFAGEHADKAGAMMLKMSFAMLLMAGVVKIASGFTNDELKRGLKFVAGVEILFAGLIAISHLSGENAKKAGKMISSMGIAMLAMVFAIKIVSGMNESDINKGLGVVSAIMVLFAGVVAVSKFAGEHAMKAGIMLLAMSIALGVMIALTWIVSKLDPKEMWKGLAFVAALEAMMAGLIAVTKYSKATKQLNATLTRFIIIIALMVAAVIGLSFIEPKNLEAATGALSGVMGMFAVMMAATKYTKNTKHMRKSLLALLGVTAVLAGIIAALSLLNPDSALKSATSLSLLLLSFSSSIYILGKAGRVSKTAIDALKPMLAIAAGLGGILAVFAILNKFGMEASLQSAVALGILLNAFTASIVVLSKAGSVSKTAMSSLKPMLAIAAGLGGILAVFGILNKFGMEPSIQSAAALGILLNAFAASIVILGKVGSVSKSALAALNPMLIVAAGLGTILAIFGILSKYGIEPSTQTAIALGILLNAFSASIFVLSLAGRVSKTALTALQPMVLITAELAVILGLMSALDVEASIPSAMALGLLLNLLATSLVVLSFVGPTATAAIPAAIAMGLVVMELALAMGIMASMDVDSAIPYAISLGILLTALTVGVGILGLIAPLIPAAIPAVVGLGVVIAELAILLAAMCALAQIPGLEWLISEGGDFLQTIGTAIGKFVGGIVGGIAEGVTSVLPEIAKSLTAFMENIQGFIEGAQGISSDLLTGVAYLSGAILLLIGSEFLAGLASLSGISLTELGQELSGFILAAMPFITGIQTINPESVEAAKTLAEMILVLTAAELLSGITSFIGGNVDFSSFGTQLQAFGEAVVSFSDIVDGKISEESVTAAANAGKAIASLQNELYGVGGLKQDIFGEKDLGVFSSQLTTFGEAIVAFSSTVKDQIDEKDVEAAARAGESIAGLQNALYGAGGLKQDIFGEKDLSLFSTQLTAFGEAIVDFSATVKDQIDQGAVDAAKSAGDTMVALQKSIESSGGFKQDLFGEKSLETFGNQVVAFGQAMVDFSSIVDGNISEASVTAASNAGTVMATLQDAIPEEKFFDGKVSLEDFGKKIKKFGEHIAEYSTEVADIDGESVSNSITAANRLVRLTNSVVDLDTSGIDLFKKVNGLGVILKDYAANVAEIDHESITSSVSDIKKLVNLINSMVDIDGSGVAAFEAAVSDLSNIDLSGLAKTVGDVSKFTAIGGNIVDAIRNGISTKQVSLAATGNSLVTYLLNGITAKRPAIVTTTTAIISDMITNINAKKEVFRTTGILLITNLNNGVRGQIAALRSTVGSATAAAVNTVRGYYNSFYNAGTYLVDGFVSGISANTWKAAAQAKAMAEAAEKAAKEALDINSPSRVFRTIGEYTAEGFAQGIDRMAYAVQSSAVSMSDTAITSVSKSIAQIAEAVNTDIDTQPTIRPVLDLSDVRSGASSISGLFDMNPTVGVMANANSIGMSMNSRQNGVGNGDVVSAIDKLRDKLNNVGNTTYSVNGITYSRGTEVADAIEVLVHGALVEGRI